MKTFTELKNAQAIVIAYDGLESHASDVLLSEALLQRSSTNPTSSSSRKENSNEWI